MEPGNNEIPRSREPEDIKAQNELLTQIQEGHGKTFEETGIAETVRTSLARRAPTAQIERLVASVVHVNTDQGPDIQQYSVAVMPPDPETSSSIRQRIHYVNVAQELDTGVVLPLNDFDQADADTVREMIKGLRELKATGILPNLEPDCMRISDPHTEIMLLPPKE